MSAGDEQLRQIAHQQMGVMPQAPAETPARFLENAHKWLVEWCVETKVRTNCRPGCCAIVLAPNIVAGKPSPDYTELRVFKNTYPATLAGSIYVCDYALNRVHCKSIPADDMDGVLNALVKEGLEKAPAVLFDIEIQKACVFEEGVAGKQSTLTLRAPLPQPFNFNTFVNLMKEVHEQDLEYPTEQPRLWSDPPNRVPCEATERVIQLHLVHALTYTAYMANLEGGGWVIARESEHIAGRTDITVRTGNKCLVAAEIKVLRHRRHPKKGSKPEAKQSKKTKTPNKTPKPKKAIPVSANFNEWWALRGANQAMRYKSKEKAEEGVLLIYDMRASNGDIASVVTECKKLNVHHKRYFLQNKLP